MGEEDRPEYFGGHLRHVAALAILDRYQETKNAVESYLRNVPSEAQSHLHVDLYVDGVVQERPITPFS